MCLNIQSALSDRKKLVVYLRCQLDVDEKRAGSKSTSWLDPELHTIEEKRTEYIRQCHPDHCDKPTYLQSLYMAVQHNNVFVNHVLSSCSAENKTERYYDLNLSKLLLGEGATFVLMRVLALAKFVGQFELQSLYINGDICRTIIQCTGPESGLVNKKKMDICTIYRIIHEECGIKHISKTVLTITGRIITHEWDETEYCIYINPSWELSLSPLRPCSERVDWSEDLQLYSMYLDRKDLCSSKYKTYMSDRPDIQTILSDYVQSILEMKPADVVRFTMEYFKRFG